MGTVPLKSARDSVCVEWPDEPATFASYGDTLDHLLWWARALRTARSEDPHQV
jgi:hypothetical protein